MNQNCTIHQITIVVEKRIRIYFSERSISSMSDTENIYEQLTLDDILKKDLLSDSVSSEDISKIIVELQKAKQKAKKREQALKIEKQKRREREEQAEKETHINGAVP